MIRTPALLLAALLVPGPLLPAPALAHHDERHPAANLSAQSGRSMSDAMPEPRRPRAQAQRREQGNGEAAGNEEAAARLRAAQTALRAGRAAEASNLLEQAESRLLTRGTLASSAGQPVLDGAVGRTAAARAALGRNDRAGAAREIEAALAAMAPRPARAPRTPR